MASIPYEQQPGQRPGGAERRALIDEIKSRPCADCKCSFPPYVMEFDHARGQKCFEIGNNKYVALDRILEEAKKCDVVCSNCHAIRTHERRLQTSATFNATDWSATVEIPLDRGDALMVGQSLRTLARAASTPKGTRDIFDRVGTAMAQTALGAIGAIG